MTFQYIPLDLSRQDIRLLRINFSGGRRYQLVPVVPLSIAKYVALSYPWGNYHDTSTMSIDGHEFRVSTNLVEALDAVAAFWTRSYPTRENMFLWTDQICINQSNDREKSHQVGMMAQIYARAHQVLVWLPTSSGIADGFDGWPSWRDWHRGQILNSGLQHLPQPTNVLKYAGNNNLVYPCLSTEDVRHRDVLLAWSHIHGIVCSPWWERGWIYQEFIEASKVTFLFSGMSTTWEKLHELLALYFSQRDAHVQFCTDTLNALKGTNNTTAFRVSSWFATRQVTQPKDPKTAKSQRDIFRHHGQQIMSAAAHWKRVNYILLSKVDWLKRKNSNATPYIPLSTLMKHSRNCALSNPKDKAYAFTGLAHPAHSVKIDYADTYPVNNVLADVARAIIETEQRLDIIAVARENTNVHDIARNQLPSWVPDWSTPDDANSSYRQFLRQIRFPLAGFPYSGTRGPCRASGDMKPVVSFHPDSYGNPYRFLLVKGTLVDEYVQITMDLEFMLYRSFRTRSGRTVETVKDADVGDEAWILFGADEVYTLHNIGHAYVILGHAMIQESGGGTSDIMHGSLLSGIRASGVQTGPLPRREATITTVLIS